MQDYIPRKIDINEQLPTVVVKQFDNLSRFIHVQIFDNDLPDLSDGEKYFNLENCTARLYVQPKGDDSGTNVAYIDGEVADDEHGIVTFLLPSSVTETAGNYEGEIWIYGAESSRPIISTKSFNFVVEKSIRNNTAIEGTSKFTALDNALNAVGDIENDFTAMNQRIDYLSNYVTPQMFGAAGNGTTDDTNAVIDCLTYAYENKLTAYFPDGSYLTTQEIVQTGFPTVKMDGIVVYDGDGIALKFTRDRSVGTNGINHNLSLNVKRKTLSSADGRDNIGIVIDSLSTSTISIGLCENFDIGLKITTDNTRSVLLNRFFINDIKATTNCILVERTGSYAINGNNFYGGYLRKSGTYTDSEAIKINGGQNSFTGFYIESFYAAIHFANGSTNYARISAELCTNVQVVSGTANRNIVETIYPTNNAFVSDGNYVPFKSQTTFDAYIERVYTNRIAHHVLMDEYVNDGTNTAFTDCKFVNSSSGEFASYRSSFNVTFSGNIATLPAGSWAVAFTVNSQSAKNFCIRSDLAPLGTQAIIVRLRDSNGDIITSGDNVKLANGTLSVNKNWGGANGGVYGIPKDASTGEFSVFSVTADVKYIDFIIPPNSSISVIDIYTSQQETSAPIHENTSLPNAPTSASYQGRTVFANSKIYIYDGSAWVAIT